MKYLLFTTTTCQKCKGMKAVVKKLNCDGEVLNEEHDNFYPLATDHKVTAVPTLIIIDGDDVKRFTEDYEVEKFFNL